LILKKYGLNILSIKTKLTEWLLELHLYFLRVTFFRCKNVTFFVFWSVDMRFIEPAADQQYTCRSGRSHFCRP